MPGATTSPTCVSVIDVSQTAGGAIWTFSDDIDAPGDPSGLSINGQPGLALSGQSGPSITVSYAAPINPGDPWAATLAPGDWTWINGQELCSGQTGTVS